MAKSYSEISDYIRELSEISNSNNNIKPEMYTEHNVYRGLRDLSGNGVVTGLTEISRVQAKERNADGELESINGRLYYRGLNIKDIVKGFTSEDRFGFEETVYLLLFSELPTSEQLERFKETLADMRTLPKSFTRDMILKAPSQDMMNMISRCVLALYSYDENPDDISIPNVLRQCLFLISVFPLLSVYAYQSYQHYYKEQSLNIHLPKPEYSIAENILYLLRGDKGFKPIEAKILDMALVIHAEHGGGNNSSFTTHVVSSSGTDTYSAISAALGSLKGPRHGGANIKVVQMFEDMKKNIDVKDRAQITDYLNKLLNKEAFDGKGLIYGMGHAIYSISDPRAEILQSWAKELAIANGYEEEYELYTAVAEIAPDLIAHKRKMYKGVSPNVDFYSGLVYKMLDLPGELFTPLFAIARIAGWSAHRIEEIQNNGKIIRPAYLSVKAPRDYTQMKDR